MIIFKKLSIKDSAVKREGGFSSVNILRTRRRGILQMRTSELFGAKHCRFFEVHGVSARTRVCRFFEVHGVSVRTRGGQCGHFVNKGKGVNLSKFCANIIYGSAAIVHQTIGKLAGGKIDRIRGRKHIKIRCNNKFLKKLSLV